MVSIGAPAENREITFLAEGGEGPGELDRLDLLPGVASAGLDVPGDDLVEFHRLHDRRGQNENEQHQAGERLVTCPQHRDSPSSE